MSGVRGERNATGEYDRIYAIPERQPDLQRLREAVIEFGRGRRLLEIACGTGYWTEVVAPAAASVTATDSVEAVLTVARGRGLPADGVRFLVADAFGLDVVPGEFDGGFAGFWWSHVRRADLAGSLARIHKRLGAGAAVLFFDNRFVAGSSTAIGRTDEGGSTYQQRVLLNGTRYEVVKKFPSAEDVRRQLVDAGGRAIRVEESQYHWHATYEVGGVV